MNYSKALELIQTGHQVYRKGWNGKGQWVQRATDAYLVKADGTTVKMKPFTVLFNAQGEFIPWSPSQGDQDATDWEVLEEC